MRLSEAYKEFLELKKSKGPRSRKTAARYELSLRNFCLCMHDPRLEDLTINHILWYLNELERLGWKSAGRNLIALAIRKFFEFCNIRGYQTFNEQLIPLPERTYSLPRVANIETFTKVFNQIGKSNRAQNFRNRALLSMLWESGARSGEILSLNESDLDLKNRTAYIKTEKSRGRRPIRQIFWTEKSNQYIKAWLEKKHHLAKFFDFDDKDALFLSVSRCRQYETRGRRMTPNNVCEIMRVLSNRAGIPTVNAHSLRHSMGRDVIKVEKSNSAVSNILGHSNLDSSMVYTMLFGDDLKEVWNRVIKRRRI